MATPCEPSASVDAAVQAPGMAPGRGPMRMPRRQRWVPTGILAKVDEVVVPVAPPVQYQRKAVVEVQEESEEEVEVVLPKGTPLMTVAGIELPENAIGPALEFLEFCSAFYKPLGLKTGDGEKALQEIVNGFNIKRGTQCPVVQAHVRLLSVILYETDEPCNVSCGLKGKTSWLEVLKKYLYKRTNPHSKDAELKDADGERENEPKDAEMESLPPPPPSSSSVASPSCYPFQESTLKFASVLERGADGYASLATDEKLQLLNTLCNDALGTGVIRGHIEDVITEYEERRRVKREKSLAAKKKMKLGQENEKDSKLTKLLAAGKNRGPLSQEQQTQYVAKLRAEAMKGSTLEPTTKKEPEEESEALRSDAVRTEAIAWDKGARAVWKLKGGNDRTSIALQDITNIDGVPKENWSVYSDKDQEVLAAYLTQKKMGTHRRRPRKRYQLKTLEEYPVGSADVPTDAMDVASDREDSKAHEPLPSDGDIRASSASSDDSGSDHESEPEEDPME